MYFACSCLRFALRVTGSAEECAALLGPGTPHEHAKCPECGSQLQHASFLDSDTLARIQFVVREVTPMEAHLVLEGLGFPEERSCGEDTVRAALVGQRIRAVDVREIRGTGRTVVDNITLEDGTTLFLAGSGWGATVYRVRAPNPYVSKEEP